jgi:2-amino-4-hydroxy-6-hydroxymethyldihydropteridine diphosphokinase
MPRVYIGIGSNIGRRAQNIERGLRRLQERGFRIVRRSRVYETEPWHMNDCRKFLNLVVAADTRLTPRVCLMRLLEVERALGRRRHGRNEPRTLDLDILMYGTRIIRQPGLTVPHPRLHERAFVLKPFCDIAPKVIQPARHQRMSTLLKRLDQRGVHLWKHA